MSEYLRVLRMHGVHDAQSVGSRSPEAAAAVRHQPGVGDGQTAKGVGFIGLTAIQDGGVVFEGVQLAAAFGIAPDAQQAFPGGLCYLWGLSVSDILVVHQAACKPKPPVGSFKYLIIRVIAFGVPLEVGAAGVLLNALAAGKFQKQGIPYGGPYEALLVGIQGADITFHLAVLHPKPVGASNP